MNTTKKELLGQQMIKTNVRPIKSTFDLREKGIKSLNNKLTKLKKNLTYVNLCYILLSRKEYELSIYATLPGFYKKIYGGKKDVRAGKVQGNFMMGKT